MNGQRQYYDKNMLASLLKNKIFEHNSAWLLNTQIEAFSIMQLQKKSCLKNQFAGVVDLVLTG